MKELYLPASYASLSEAERRAIDGGGELKDAAGGFFDNVHLDDFSLHRSFISVSFTFVPFLLFNLVKVGFGVIQTVSGNINTLFKLSSQLGTKLLDSAAGSTGVSASN